MQAEHPFTAHVLVTSRRAQHAVGPRAAHEVQVNVAADRGRRVGAGGRGGAARHVDGADWVRGVVLARPRPETERRPE
eukprot:2142059-Prymnesium_polylepis.1